MHKTTNVLNHLPKSTQPTQSKHYARSGWRRLGRCHFPAEHWVHLRTTNPYQDFVEFIATHEVKHPKGDTSLSERPGGILSRQTMLTMMFKLCRRC